MGACGRVEVTVTERNGDILFAGMEYDDYEHSKGLGDFIEGRYYIDKNVAELKFYKNQFLWAQQSMERQKRVYETSKAGYDKVKLIVERLTKTLAEKSA